MESLKKPIVSVIIPTYNASLFIAETISSILSQSMPEFEIIIVDDGSTDNTLKIVQDLARIDKRIRYFIQERSGVSVARNRGIKESVGRYIAFIDHDDLWMPQKLEKQLAIFNKDSQLGLIFSRASIMMANGESTGLVGGIARFHRGYIFRELFSEHFVPISTVLIRRDVFDGLDEWFDKTMEMAEEVDLFLRIAYNWKIDYSGEILAKWRMHPNNDSRLRRSLLIKDYKRIIDRLKEKIPDFEKKYKKEIFKKQRWIATTEIEVLLSENNKKLAIKKLPLFLKTFGFHPKSMTKVFLLFSLGFDIYEKIRINFLYLYSKINKRISIN